MDAPTELNLWFTPILTGIVVVGIGIYGVYDTWTYPWIAHVPTIKDFVPYIAVVIFGLFMVTTGLGVLKHGRTD